MKIIDYKPNNKVVEDIKPTSEVEEYKPNNQSVFETKASNMVGLFKPIINMITDFASEVLTPGAVVFAEDGNDLLAEDDTQLTFEI